MRIPIILTLAVVLSACASSLERQADSAAKGDCWQQARAYVQANVATIANEWRQHERYKYYQRCLAERTDSTS